MLIKSSDTANWSTLGKHSTLRAHTLDLWGVGDRQWDLFLLPDEDLLPVAGEVGLHLPPDVQHQLPLPVAEPHGAV